jgi:NAD(P)-dependent dehydrogenase (short-subunit alcohol dehydrogenase family)
VKRIALLGGTKGIGRAVARQLVARGDRVALLGREPADLAASAADLAARSPAGGPAPVTGLLDLAHADTFGAALDDAARQLGGLDAVVVTAGAFGTQEALEADAAARARVLTINFTQTIQFCEAARVRLIEAGGGTLCVLGSVAGDRARKPVVLYGATKAGLAYYMEGIDLRYRDAGLRAVLIKPGFVRTGMTAGLPEPPFAANPDDIAPAIVKAIDRGTPQIYVPAIWRLVMLVIRSLPGAVMRRVKF